MKLLFINNDGGGFADYLEAGPGTNVATFFQEPSAPWQTAGLLDPREPPTGSCRLCLAGGRSNQLHPNQNPRGAACTFEFSDCAI